MILSDYMSYAIVGVVGFSAGAIIQFGTLKIRGKKIILPFIESSARNLTLLAVGLGLLSLFTIIQVDQSSKRAEDCQVEYQTALQYNAEIASQERSLEERERSLTTERADQFSTFLEKLISPGADARTLITELSRQETAINTSLSDLAKERIDLAASRSPYPEPLCGK